MMEKSSIAEIVTIAFWIAVQQDYASAGTGRLGQKTDNLQPTCSAETKNSSA